MIILSTAFDSMESREEGGGRTGKVEQRQRNRDSGGEGDGLRVGHSVYMHACERLSTDSACGMRRWVTDMPELAAMPHRIMHPSAGMSRITTTIVYITTWTYSTVCRQ